MPRKSRKDLDENGGVPPTPQLPDLGIRRRRTPGSSSSITGRIEKTVRNRHTGWAVAVGRKHAEKIGATLTSKFFEAKPQDPVMLMNRPLLERPSSPANGIPMVKRGMKPNGFYMPLGTVDDRVLTGSPENRLGNRSPRIAGGPRPFLSPRPNRPGPFQFRSASERVAMDTGSQMNPFYRSASERIAAEDRAGLDRRSASERVVYDDDV